jgi:AcrR family transcriptional regulator
MDSTIRYTRRTEGKRVHGRSARVLEAVLEAAAEELGRVGFSELRVEDVALRSGVNKTTIYRRWPNKEELVASVLEAQIVAPSVLDTGSLHGDLLALLHEFKARAATPEGRGLARVIQAERGNAQFLPLVHRMRSQHMAVRGAIFERAIARAEIPRGSDCKLLVELLMAPLVSRLVHLDSDADERFLQVLVNMVVAGAKAGAGVPPDGVGPPWMAPEAPLI